MAQQGDGSPRIFLVGPGVRIDAGPAAVPDVTSIAAEAAGVNLGPACWPDVRPNRDLAGRGTPEKISRHTGPMPPDAPAAMAFLGSVTAREESLDRYSIDVSSVVSASDSINPQYRERGRAREDGISLPARARGALGRTAKIGVDMPPLCTVVEASMTGVNAA